VAEIVNLPLDGVTGVTKIEGPCMVATPHLVGSRRHVSFLAVRR
jgi:hypothetical protein